MKSSSVSLIVVVVAVVVVVVVVVAVLVIVSCRVVKTAHSFWPVNRDQKDRLTAAAYAAPAAIVPQASLFAGRLSLTAVGLSAVTAVALPIL